MRSRVLVTLMVALMMVGVAPGVILVTGEERPSMSFEVGAYSAPVSFPRAIGSRGFNQTEHMGNTSTAPTIDGTLDPGEWDDAAVYDIGENGKRTVMYIMYNDSKIFVAIDAISDVTDDLDDPGGTGLINANGDYFTISIDGENDDNITYQAIDQGGNDWPSEWPFTGANGGGECVDRGAITHGGVSRTAGWWHLNSAGTGNTLFIWSPGDGPNMGTGEPYDYLNPGFSDHRTFEYSIPYTGVGDSLNRSVGKRIGMVVLVNDGRGASSSQTIGRMPADANSVSGPPYQEFMINGKPKAVLAPVSPTLVYTGDTIDLDGSASTEPDGEAITYHWDLDYDGATFDNDSTDATTSVSYDTPGTYTIAFLVEDPHGASDIRSVVIDVVDHEHAPSLSNITPLTDPTIEEGEDMTFSVEYDDPNLAYPGEELFVEWTLDGLVVSTEGATEAGNTTYAIQTSFTGNFSAGTYDLKVSVNDSYDAKGKYTGGSQVIIQEWTLTVTDVNRAPEITSYSPLTLNGHITDEETPVSFTITKDDPDGDTLTVNWYVDDAVQQSHSDSFVYLAEPDHGAAGLHNVKVVVTDSGDPPLTADLTWNLIVDNVNRAPTISFVSPTDKMVRLWEGEGQDFKIVATDLDEDDLTYTWYLDGDVITDIGDFDYTFDANYTRAREADYILEVYITDGLETVSKDWAIIVKDVDRLPIVSISRPKEGDHFPLSALIDYDCSGTVDPDGDRLSYEWVFGDTGSKRTATASHLYTDPGEYKVQLTVTSKHEGVDYSQMFTINITIDAAELEVLSITPDVNEVTQGDKVTIAVTIKNKGVLDAKDVSIELFLDSTMQLETMEHVGITAGATEEFTFEWTADKLGIHDFKVALDVDDDTVVDASTIRSDEVKVNRPARTPVEEMGLDLTSLLILLVVIILVVVLMVVFVARSRSRRRREEEEKAGAEAEAAQKAVMPQQAAPPPSPPQDQYDDPFKPKPIDKSRPPPPPPPPPPLAGVGAASPFAQRQAKKEVPPPPPEKGVEVTVKMAEQAANAGICPGCGEDVGPLETRCKCDQPLLVLNADEKKEQLKMEQQGIGPGPKPTTKASTATEPKCPKCGEETEADWVKCPFCEADL